MTFFEVLRSISKKEWRLVFGFSVVLALITLAPIIYGFLITPPGQIFSGMHFVSADDWFVYYSFINQAKAGKIFFNDLYASIPHLGVLRPEWLAVGFFAKIFNLSALASFQLVRIILIPALFFIIYLFLAYFFSKVSQRIFALFFLSFVSGLGVFFIHRLLLFPQNYYDFFRWPMDLWVPDVNLFYSFYTSPHFIAATIFLVIIFFLTILFSEKRRYRYSVFAGLAGLFLFSFHPFQVLKVYVIMALFFLALMIIKKKIDWPFIFYFLIFFVLSFPSALYYLWLLKYDWLTLLRASQNINPTTPLDLTLVSLGGLFVGSVSAVYFLIKEKKWPENKYLFLMVWAVAQLILLYASVSYQRRLGLGLQLPFALLTLWALFYFYENYQAWIKKHLAILMILGGLIFLPSTMFVLASDVMVFSQGRGLAYIDQDVYQGFLWLKKNTPENSIIFSALDVGKILPAYSLRTTYVGHAVETPYYRQRKIEPAWFFAKNRDPKIEKNFLIKRGVDYFFYGLAERALGDFSPEIKPYLREVYRQDEVIIYQVI